MIFAVLPIAET